MGASSDQPARFRWQVVAASVRGTRHEKNNQPSQDALLWRELPPHWQVAVLADGAGSALQAEVGASTACRAALEAIVQEAASLSAADPDEAWQSRLRGAIRCARAAVEAEARNRKSSVRDLATTLTILVVAPDFAAAAQIGDGAALTVEAGGEFAVLTGPCGGEYLNETAFLTSDNAVETAQVALRRARIKHAALFCDGLQMLALKMPGAAPHTPFFAPLFRFVEAADNAEAAGAQLAAFLRSPKVTQRTDDDLSLWLAVGRT